jgi:glycosyltransferase involved in cell wall biosynthesis
MRLAVYTDYVYRRVGGVTYAERAFALFLAALAPRVERLRLVGRLAQEGGVTRYQLPAGIELAPLPHYASLADPVAALRSLVRSLGHMNRALNDVDVIWILGPYPHAVVLALLACVRRRSVVLGVRQDWPAYVRMRRPGKRWMHVSADVLEWIWRRLARRLPVVAVGPDLAAQYAHAPAVLDLIVSLVPATAVGSSAAPGDYSRELRVLSVGRLDEEKNPLLLAEVLALLHRQSPHWRLLVCGEGTLAGALSARLAELGLADRAELLGYVAMGDELLRLYRSCHALLHVSWTEGFPQVLIEAFATGLPVVATAVGGVAAAAGDAAVLIPAGAPEAAADALLRVAGDPDLRARLTTAGLERARELTLEAQTARLARFLEQARPRRQGEPHGRSARTPSGPSHPLDADRSAVQGP